MNGCVMEEESVYHSYGLSVSGTVGALSFTEEYKKTELSLSGFYNYQSGVKGNPSIKINPFIFIKFLQSGLDGIFKWLDMPFDGDMNDVMKDAGFRSALFTEIDNSTFIIAELSRRMVEFGSRSCSEAPRKNILPSLTRSWNTTDQIGMFPTRGSPPS